MGNPLPRVLGTLSDSTKLKFSNINSQLVEMLMLAVITEDFANLTAWTETDSGGNVNLVGDGTVSFNGNGAYANNGIRLTTGVTLGEGYFEVKMSAASISLLIGLMLQTNNAAALPAATSTVGTYGGYYTTNCFGINIPLLISTSTLLVANTWYTFRIYVKKANNGTYKRAKTTIQGGVWTNETLLAEIELLVTAFADPLYFALQRYTNDATKLSLVKEFRWYSGYATNGPYVEYIHDAGAGKVFDNLDFTAFAMPGTVPVTNLKCAYSFDDGSASYSSYLTLAGGVGSLQAVGKIIARHRYVRLRVQGNSDGPTQVYIDKPNSDTATDGVGDFPAVSSVRAPNTVQLVEGTQTALATDADFLALEAGRNITAGAANIIVGAHEHIQGAQIDGALVALAVPAAPTNLVFTNISDNGFRVSWTPGARSETYKVYVDGVLHTSGISDAYLDIGSRSPLTSYSITVLGTNITGDGAASSAYTVTTLASDGIEDSTTLSTDGVTVATVSGSPKIVGSGATNKIYDVRIINKALTAKVSSYYWKDVLENEGKVVIPR